MFKKLILISCLLNAVRSLEVITTDVIANGPSVTNGPELRDAQKLFYQLSIKDIVQYLNNVQEQSQKILLL